MADEEEERVLEQQLELQLHEQRESLSSLNDILTSDPSNHEVLSVRVLFYLLSNFSASSFRRRSSKTYQPKNIINFWLLNL